MSQLTFEPALKLYELLAEYLVEPIEEETIFSYVSRVIENIPDDSNVYLDSIELMSGLGQIYLLTLSIPELLDLFIEGLVENEILALRLFLREIHYG